MVDGKKVGKRYSQEEKDAIIADFKASGKSLNLFCKDGMPSIQTLQGWMGITKKGAKEEDSLLSGGSYDSGLYGEFTKSLIPADADKRYIRFLEGKVRELEDELTRLKADK